MERQRREQGPEKKLIEAARRWAEDSPGKAPVSTDEHRESLRNDGLSEAQIDEILGVDEAVEEQEPDEFLIWPENWDCWNVFKSLWSRWPTDGLSGRFYGIERPDIESTLRILQIDPSKHAQIFEQFQVMEREVLEVFNREK